jgi:hypothetical protein
MIYVTFLDIREEVFMSVYHKSDIRLTLLDRIKWNTRLTLNRLKQIYNLVTTPWSLGARGSLVVKALCYKPEGRGFDTRWGEFLNLPNPSGLTTQPLT